MILLRSLIGTITIDGILAMLLFWLLPEQNVELSVALKIALLVILPLWSILTYIPKKRALGKEVIEPAQAMIGKRGVAINRLDPKGTVRINYEIWNASSSGDAIEEGERIVVLGIDGLVLTVQKKDLDKSNHASSDN
jgi:membrane-bound serine protease (ClpP class)